MEQTFEEFLEEKCFEENSVLDDDMPDFFNNWLGELDGQEYIDFADEYAQKEVQLAIIETKEKMLEKFSPAVLILEGLTNITKEEDLIDMNL